MVNITDKDYGKLIKEFGNKLPEQELVKWFKAKNLKIATAESCTGGMISEKITSVSGASEIFDCGICTYANRIKEKLVGVSAQTLNTVGAVSPRAAEQMARGVRELANADVGISTTGIAGPNGGTEEKPVGLVYIGVSTKERTQIYQAELCKFEKRDRTEIRDMASDLAIIFALQEIDD